jgi:DNA polymerase-3 subunit alpha
MQIEVMPPDINHSRQSFTVVHGAIRFGFKAIKNLGDGAIESILKNRDEKGPFISLSDFLSRVDLRLVNKRALESLIKCGAMDEFGKRSGLLKVMETSLDSANRRQKTKATGQTSLFGAAMDSGESLQDALPDEPEFPRLDLLKMEKELIGIYVTDHPLNLVAGGRFETKVKNFSRELLELPENTVVKVGGIITSLRKIVTKTNRQMLAGTLEDTKGKFNFVLFPQQYEQWSDFFTEDGIVLIEGKVTVNRDEPQVVVEKVEKIEAGSHKQLFHVEIKGIDDAGMLNQLKNILASSPGTTPVVLHTLDAKVLTDEASWVNVTPALITGIAELVGKGRYWVE